VATEMAAVPAMAAAMMIPLAEMNAKYPAPMI
jgi:hypothetical protein